MSETPLYILDVFAQQQYTGNQLAVICNSEHIAEENLQRIAREMNFSETTFVRGRGGDEEAFDVRIFTPSAEIPFAGHPTLGTAHVIRNYLLQEKPERVTVNLQNGPIEVTFQASQGSEIAWFHQRQPSFQAEHPVAPIAHVLGLPTDAIDQQFPIEEVSMGVPFTIVPLRSLDALQQASFEVSRILELEYQDFSKQVCLFCPGARDPQNHLSMRMFAPMLGVPEDPATGSACACLAGYLLQHRYFGKDAIEIRVEQGHEIGRPSLLHVDANRTSDEMDIRVGGNVIVSAVGRLV